LATTRRVGDQPRDDLPARLGGLEKGRAAARAPARSTQKTAASAIATTTAGAGWLEKRMSGERPAVVERRKQIGHGEIDTMMGQPRGEQRLHRRPGRTQKWLRGDRQTGRAKLRGIRTDSLIIHLKESEWRWNHRDVNLYPFLLKLLRSEPL